MNQSAIALISGPPGAGKTTWIRQNLDDTSNPIVYFSPGNNNVPIDQTIIAAEFPHCKTLTDGQELELLKLLGSGYSAYIEIGFHLELSEIDKIIGNLPHQRIALIPAELKQSEWHEWANKIIPGAPLQPLPENLELWRVPMTGQMLYPDSLNAFWYELTQQAYGTIYRAKAIFDLADWRSIYGEFIPTIEGDSFIELSLPRWLEGRPARFSGLEVFGQNLDQPALAQTIKDSCLTDTELRAYQQRLKQAQQFEEIPA